jgi:hypothetical protein
MLAWESKAHGSSTTYSAMSNVSDWKELPLALQEFWRKLLDSVQQVVQGARIDHIYLELWIDSGRVIGYPGTKGGLRSDWPVAVQAIFPLVLKASEELPDPDSDPAAFEIAATALESKFWQALRKASNDKDVRLAIGSLRKSHDFTVWRQSADNQNSLEQFHLTA